MPATPRTHDNFWFLFVFAAAFWLLVLTVAFAYQFLAALGLGLLTGFGVITMIAAVAGFVVLALGIALAVERLTWSAFVKALLCGTLLAGIWITAGWLKHAAAAVWWVECNADRGDACHGLALYHDSGASLLTGSIDAMNAHRRACELGGELGRKSCAVLPETDGMTGRKDSARQCELGDSLGCWEFGRSIESSARRGADYARAYHYYRKSCALSRSVDTLAGCAELVESGNTRLRATGCAEFREKCRVSDSWACTAYLHQCERVAESPF